MDTSTLVSGISAEEMLYLIMKFAPSTVPGQRPRLERMITPPARKGVPTRLVKTPWHVHLCNDDRSDTELVIELRGDVILGTRLDADDDTDIDLKAWKSYDLGVSRRHLLLRPTENNLFALDLGSTNGSSFNGLPMTPSRVYSLSSGDLLTLGHLHVRVSKVSKATGPIPKAPPKTQQFNEAEVALMVPEVVAEYASLR